MPVANVTTEIVYITYNVEATVHTPTGDKTVTVACVQLLTTGTATITVYDEATDSNIARFDTTQQFFAKVALCVPEELGENNINIKTLRTNLVVLNNRAPINGILSVEFDFCLDIQVELEVKLQVYGTFCHPRPNDIVCPDGGSIDCSEVPFPAQCPIVFPR